MIPVASLKGKFVAIFGLGASGVATCRAIMAGGGRVIAFDDNPESVRHADNEGIPTQDLHRLDWSEITALVLTPGVPLTHPAPHWSATLARKASVEVIGDIELFCRERRLLASESPFIAITGTNGKSTTTALLGHVLRSSGMIAEIGGNIGTPILSLHPPSQSHAHVIECSSFQIDLAPSLDPKIGILLNISADHLDRHGTLAEYAAIKERLVAGVQDSGVAIIGVDDDHCRAIADRLEQRGVRVVRVSVESRLDNGLYVESHQLIQAADGDAKPIMSLAGVGSLRGAHNAQNAACAAAAGLALGLDVSAIVRGLETFPGLAHRMEQVAKRGSVLFINDSKATNADAAARALASFSDIFWIAGGKPKAGGISSLDGYFPRIRKAYLIGESSAEFAKSLEGRAPYIIAGTLERAIALAARDAAASDAELPVVLLSPACASYDQFKNFEVRGDTFRDLVRGLG